MPLMGAAFLFDLVAETRLTARLMQMKEGEVTSVAFSPDGNTIAAGYGASDGGGVVLWDAAKRCAWGLARSL